MNIPGRVFDSYGGTKVDVPTIANYGSASKYAPQHVGTLSGLEDKYFGDRLTKFFAGMLGKPEYAVGAAGNENPFNRKANPYSFTYIKGGNRVARTTSTGDTRSIWSFAKQWEGGGIPLAGIETKNIDGQLHAIFKDKVKSGQNVMSPGIYNEKERTVPVEIINNRVFTNLDQAKFIKEQGYSKYVGKSYDEIVKRNPRWGQQNEALEQAAEAIGEARRADRGSGGGFGKFVRGVFSLAGIGAGANIASQPQSQSLGGTQPRQVSQVLSINADEAANQNQKKIDVERARSGKLATILTDQERNVLG